jgi:hypothetical protein
VDLGIRTITGRKRFNWWISFKSTLEIGDSDSSKKISASACPEAREICATWLFITNAADASFGI